MISIMTRRGIIEMKVPAADCGTAIKGECDHGNSLFLHCFHCEPVRQLCYCNIPECRFEHRCGKCEQVDCVCEPVNYDFDDMAAYWAAHSEIFEA